MTKNYVKIQPPLKPTWCLTFRAKNDILNSTLYLGFICPLLCGIAAPALFACILVNIYYRGQPGL